MPALKRISLYQQAAQQGDAESQYQLGCIFEPDFPYNQEDWCKAIDLYQSAALQNHAKAQLKLGDCFFSGRGVSEDKAVATTFWHKAAEQGEKQAQLRLGLALWFGQGIGEDKQAALEWFQKSAEQGDNESRVRLGAYNGQAKEQYELAETIMAHCMDGSELFENESNAKDWYLASANQGYADAQFKLALLHDIFGINEKDSNDWFIKAACQGHNSAKLFLDAIKGDAESQFHWGQQVAEFDHYGWHYNNISTLKESPARWYRKAAEQGHVEAMFMFAECLKGGHGLDFALQDEYEDWDEEALKWLRRAAEKGHSEAQKHLGMA